MDFEDIMLNEISQLYAKSYKYDFTYMWNQNQENSEFPDGLPVKEPALLLLWHRFDLWPGTSLCGIKKKKLLGKEKAIRSVVTRVGRRQIGER